MSGVPLDLQIEKGDLVAIALPPGPSTGHELGIGIATGSGVQAVKTADPSRFLEHIAKSLAPRWVWWDYSTAATLGTLGINLDRCWDVLTVHRLLAGGWRTSIPTVWAWLHDLDVSSLPAVGELDFLGADNSGDDDPADPVRPDGHLRPDWTAGGWHASSDRLASWAALALQATALQQSLLDQRADLNKVDARRMQSTAHSESAAELLCAELASYGLPIDEDEAVRIITDSAGPRPTTPADEAVEQGRRDAEVLRHLDPPQKVNLRNPGEVKSMLSRNGFDLPDTRAWRLEKLRDTDPLIDALLVWRKAERIATTYGYSWLDENVADGRLRGDWSSSDGAAGRMTASAGLHNLPAPMRPAVLADPGHVFVRADLGQIEPRVLAAVSGDPALIAATADADLYQPVAKRLGVEREIAKVAVLGAMYGATTGQSAGALRGLQENFPVAMELLEAAAQQGRLGKDIFTIGGRRVRMGGGSSPDGDLDRAISAAESRGRYARNALIQGAAAEFFKVWAVIVRKRARRFGARVVLCLHDELLVHSPTEHADVVASLVVEAVAETAYYWSPQPDVRFLADVSIIQRWSEAKG